MAYDGTPEGEFVKVARTVVSSLFPIAMSSREALRTQLDAVWVELQVLQVENRKLWEERPNSVEQARELELTEQLVAIREENLQLTQQLSAVNAQLVLEIVESETPTRRSHHCWRSSWSNFNNK